MDYRQLIRRAAGIAWRCKPLWLFGFLGSLQFVINILDWLARGRFLAPPYDVVHPEWPPGWFDLFLTLAGLGVLAAGLAAEGARITGVAQVRTLGATSQAGAWRGGLARYGDLVMLSILGAIILLPVFVLWPVGSGRDLALAAAAIALFPLAQYSYIAVVVYRQELLSAVRWAWRILVRHLGATLLLELTTIACFVPLVIAALGPNWLAQQLNLRAFDPFGISYPSAWPTLIGDVAGLLISPFLLIFSTAVWTLFCLDHPASLPAGAHPGRLETGGVQDPPIGG